VTAEDVQGRKVPARGGGTCIYCGSDGGSDGLRNEHVVPYSLGGKTELLEASCRDCEGVTSYLDGYLANATFRHFRVHSGVQSRSGHPELLPATVAVGETVRVVDFARPDHPHFLNMPVWRRPGLLRGVQPSPDFESAAAHVYWHIPPNLRQALGLKDGEVARIANNLPAPNLPTFARAIAKIAYCQAVMRYGLGGFRQLAVPDLILGRYPNIPYFVGADRDDPPPPLPSGVLHSVDFDDAVVVGRLKPLVVSVRLFAHSGTPDNGMPIYQVVVGALGNPGSITRRRSLKLPRVICL
jgi:hypothetical protein